LVYDDGVLVSGVGDVGREEGRGRVEDGMAEEKVASAESHMRGHRIIWNSDIKRWVYKDSGSIADDSRLCPKCNKPPTKEGYDACLGFVEGFKSVCCGHGVHDPIWMKMEK